MSAGWQHLTTQLQELLVRQVREAHSEPSPGSASALVSRALVATRLLEKRCDQESFQGFNSWLHAVVELLEFLSAELALAELGKPALGKLVAFAEDMLKHLDTGGTLRSRVDAHQVQSLQKQIMAAWGEPGTREARQPLQPAPDVPPADIRFQVLLLVSGLLRTSALHQKLKSAHYQVVPCSDPHGAATLLRSGRSFQAVLCDQVEPTRHLSRLVRILRDRAVGTDPPLILVTGSRHAGITDHARELGAAGVWNAPFRADRLQAVIRSSAR